MNLFKKYFQNIASPFFYFVSIVNLIKTSFFYLKKSLVKIFTPITLSYSKVSTYLICPLKYKFIYYYRLDESGPKNIYGIIGEFIHGLINDL
ncbi:MAG: PD-(D/E)XK nuclease family protein, partial [Endomicrobiia bacterium]